MPNRQEPLVTPEQQQAAIQKFLHPENDRLSRERWSITLVTIMINNWDVDKLWDVVEGGYSKFASACSGAAKRHGFKEEDLRRMWHIIDKTARMNSAQRKRFTNRIIVEASR